MQSIKINARDNTRATRKLVRALEAQGFELTQVEAGTDGAAMSPREARQLIRMLRFERWIMRPLSFLIKWGLTIGALYLLWQFTALI